MFRRSGSFACYFVEGSSPDPRGEEFLAKLAENRFRTIEDAAAEQTSVGWITSGDASGNNFEMEDIDRDGAFWLRMRVDKKSAPTKWLQIHREAAEKAAGHKLSAKDRKELKEDLLSKLMPRVLPTIQMVDALYVPRDATILLFGTAKSIREAFLSLFYRSFGASLSVADPCRLAISLGLGNDRADALSRVTPIAWPGSETNQGDAPIHALPREPQPVEATPVDDDSADHDPVDNDSLAAEETVEDLDAPIREDTPVLQDSEEMSA